MFGKKTSAEELIKLYSALPDEEKQKFLTAVNEPAKATEEKEEKPDAEPVAAEPMEEQDKPAEPTEEDKGKVEEGAEAEPANDVPVEQPTPEEPQAEPTAEPEPVATEGEQPVETEPAAVDGQPDNSAQTKNVEKVLQGFADRLSGVEQALKEFQELKEAMQDYTQKQADKFGYKGEVPGAKKPIQEMSAAELKSKILKGE